MMSSEIVSHPRAAPDQVARSRARATHRFGVVLALLLATFLFLICGPSAAWTRPLTVALQGSTLVVALAAAGTRRRLQRLARSVAIFAVLLSIASLPLGGRVSFASVAVLNGLLVCAAPVAIAISILRREVIDIRTVLAALCIYVLLGLLCAFAYTVIGSVGTRSFFAQDPHATSSQYVYFSFVTLTTVGYGDLSAAANLGRALAALEALIGQIYLVTIVTVLVSNLGSTGRRRASRLR